MFVYVIVNKRLWKASFNFSFTFCHSLQLPNQTLKDLPERIAMHRPYVYKIKAQSFAIGDTVVSRSMVNHNGGTCITALASPILKYLQILLTFYRKRQSVHVNYSISTRN